MDLRTEKPKLLDLVRTELLVNHYSKKTEEYFTCFKIFFRYNINMKEIEKKQNARNRIGLWRK